MLMRYHWGLGIGHVYCHGDAPTVSERVDIVSSAPTADDAEEGSERGSHEIGGSPNMNTQTDDTIPLDDDAGFDSDDDNPEHTLDNLEEDELDVAEEDYDTESEPDIQDADEDDD